MASLDKILLKVRIKNIRDIKKATKAVKKMEKALFEFNNASEKAIESMKEFKNALPVLNEIEIEGETNA